METYKQEFIEFMIRSDVLKFGEFTTKSGRQTPFFINTGRYRTGEQITRLASYYALAIQARTELNANVLFGPAYKGIPLVVATAMALYQKHGQNLAFCFNRKEAKDHGEGGTLIGHSPRAGDRVLIVEDVTTAGTSIRETVPTLKHQADVQLAGLIVSVDRMERGSGQKNALAEIGSEFNMPAFAIVTIEDIMAYLHNRPLDGRILLDDALYARMVEYRNEYGGTA